MEEQLIGSKIFKDIAFDDRVTKDLDHCIYCTVTSKNPNSEGIKTLTYKIPLNCIKGSDIKQCPACKKIYILKDPME